ncbi:MAG: hypothetical protein ACK5SR_07115 [Burkholderiales bacterium]
MKSFKFVLITGMLVASHAYANPSVIANARSPVEFDPLYQRTEQLKKDFLECDRLSRRVILDSDTAAFCSHVTEELRKTSFDGHFETLISWWRLATVR